MNAFYFALCAKRSLMKGIKAATRLLLNTPAEPPVARRGAPAMAQRDVANSPASMAIPRHAQSAHPASTKPLRVLRVMEPGQQCASVGRMVISGRMADVCAELDRLAAREAAMS